MPTKKTKRIDFEREIINFDPPKSYKSLLYGVLTVIIFFVLVFVGLKIIAQRNAGMVDNGAVSTSQSVYIVQKGDSLWSIAADKYNDGYRWVEIAKANSLSDPNDIEAGMKLAIPDINMAIAISDSPTPTEIPLTVKPSLTIKPTRAPTISSVKTQPTSTPIPTQVPRPTAKPAPKATTTVVSGAKINGNSYTVVKGDNLWEIAVRAYGDGYKWTEIAKANKLANPDIIHSGNKFTLPR
jgi:nucleoid-associated protein YgaU